MSENEKAPEPTKQNDNSEPRQLGGNSAKPHKSHKKSWVIILCIVVLAVAGYGAYYFLDNNVEPMTNSSKQKQATPAKLQQQVLSLTAEKGGTAAQSYLDTQLKLASTPADKALVYDYMVSAASTKNDTKSALQYAIDSYNQDPTEPRAAKVAGLEQQLGNTAEALKYYKLGLNELSKSQDPYIATKKAAYEKIIKELEK